MYAFFLGVIISSGAVVNNFTTTNAFNGGAAPAPSIPPQGGGALQGRRQVVRVEVHRAGDEGGLGSDGHRQRPDRRAPPPGGA